MLVPTEVIKSKWGHQGGPNPVWLMSSQKEKILTQRKTSTDEEKTGEDYYGQMESRKDRSTTRASKDQLQTIRNKHEASGRFPYRIQRERGPANTMISDLLASRTVSVVVSCPTGATVTAAQASTPSLLKISPPLAFRWHYIPLLFFHDTILSSLTLAGSACPACPETPCLPKAPCWALPTSPSTAALRELLGAHGCHCHLQLLMLKSPFPPVLLVFKPATPNSSPKYNSLLSFYRHICSSEMAPKWQAKAPKLYPTPSH